MIYLTPPPGYLTIDECATLFGIAPRNVRRKIYLDQLDAFQPVRQILLVRKSSVLRRMRLEKNISLKKQKIALTSAAGYSTFTSDAGTTPTDTHTGETT